MNTLPAAAPDAPPRVLEQDRGERLTIDESTRGPVLLFTLAATGWLLIGTVLALVASWKLHNPGMLSTVEWLTYGRIRPAHTNAVIYGWATNAAFAVGFWLMARLCRAPLRHAGLLYVSGTAWNLAVLAGLVGILRGDGMPVEWLELPSYVSPVLFVSYALIGVWCAIMFRFRRTEQTYVAQWYLLAAFFWFPWLYSIAQVMLVFAPTLAVVQSLVQGWYAHNLAGLWFTPIGLAATYYFIPKVLGKPIHSYHLAVLGFWSFAIAFSWTGVARVTAGPVPVWVQTIGVVASLLMVVPVIVTAINCHLTTLGSFGAVWGSPTLRFVVFGAVNFTLAGLIGTAMALRSVNSVVHFTHATVAHAHHGMYAFFSMTMFGSLYFILPRMVRREWPSTALISIHFWASALGITLTVLALSIGGVVQGLQMADPKEYPEFLTIVRGTVPYLFARSMAGVLMFAGHAAFALNVTMMLVGSRSRVGSVAVPRRAPDAIAS